MKSRGKWFVTLQRRDAACPEVTLAGGISANLNTSICSRTTGASLVRGVVHSGEPQLFYKEHLWTLTRREFSGHLAKGALVISIGSSAFILGGCGLASDIEAFVPIAKASLSSIELILQTNGYPLNGNALLFFNAAIAALTALDAAAVEYGAISPPPVTAIQKLQDAIKAATDQLQTFLAALNLPVGNVLTLVIGLAQIIISTIMAFLNRVPAPPPAVRVATIAVRWRVAGAEFNVAPHARSKNGFRNAWDDELNYGKQHGTLVPKNAYI